MSLRGLKLPAPVGKVVKKLSNWERNRNLRVVCLPLTSPCSSLQSLSISLNTFYYICRARISSE